MLKFSRVTGILDVGRLGNALSRPGIDPRTWVSFAAVDAVGVDSEGVFVDVTLLPSGEQTTARAGTPYSGPGYGLHLPFSVGDEVVVGEPNGDLGHGAVVLARLQSASDELPIEAVGNPDDVVWVVKDKQNLRIVVKDGGRVVLGTVDATDAAVRGSTYRPAENSRFFAMDALAEAMAVSIAALAAARPTLTGSPSQIAAYATSIATVAVALDELTAAIQEFSAGTASYLSTTVAVGP